MDIKPLTINIVPGGCYTPAVRVKGDFCKELGFTDGQIIMIFPCDAKQHFSDNNSPNRNYVKQQVSYLENKTDRILINQSVILNGRLQSNGIQEIPFNRESYKEWCEGVGYILQGLQYLVPKSRDNKIYCFHLSLWEFFLMYIRSTLRVIPTIESVNTMITG